MYRTIDDFKSAWALEREATLQCFRSLTDESLKYHSTLFPRGLGRVAYHIAEAPSSLLADAGVTVAGPEFGHEASSTKHLITEYERASQALVDTVTKWNDDELADHVIFFGRDMRKGMLLNVLVNHQAHHRGQLTVLMREAGISIPSFFGPTIEAWMSLGKNGAT